VYFLLDDVIPERKKCLNDACIGRYNTATIKLLCNRISACDWLNCCILLLNCDHIITYENICTWYCPLVHWNARFMNTPQYRICHYLSLFNYIYFFAIYLLLFRSALRSKSKDWLARNQNNVSAIAFPHVIGWIVVYYCWTVIIS
jgi:hypothetical protein